jgi:hypothetical protein
MYPPPPGMFLRKDLILRGLRVKNMQECDSTAFRFTCEARTDAQGLFNQLLMGIGKTSDRRPNFEQSL